MKALTWAGPILWAICQTGISGHLLAQPTVGFHLSRDTIALGAQGVSYTYQIPVTITHLPPEDEPVIVEIVDLQTGSASPLMYDLETESVIFTPNHKLTQPVRLNIKGNLGKLPDYDIHLTISVISGWAKVDISSFFLILKVPQNLHQNDYLNAYKLSIGANFDLIDGLSINSSYADISIFHPQLWSYNPGSHRHKKKRLPKDRWGMDIWLYQNRSVTEQGTQSSFDSTIFSHASMDTVVQSANNFTTDNLGIYFSPLYRIGGQGPSVNNSMSIYLIGQMEFTRFKTIGSQSQGLIKRRQESEENLSFMGFTGGGLLFHHSTKSIDFMLKLTTGITFFDHPASFTMKGGVSPDLPRPGYYQSQLRIQEKQFGLKLGADIRGYFISGKRTGTNYQYYPAFTLFLAKEFSFGQISKLFGPVGERK